MNTRKGRDGPDKEEGGRAQPSQARSTPKALPTESASAFFYANAETASGQGGADPERPKDPELVDRLPVLWDSDWQQDGKFNVRFRILGAVDGGARRRWAERMLFSPPTGEGTHKADGSAE